MTSYEAPNSSNIFNPSDFDTDNDNENENENENNNNECENNNINHDNFVTKTGSIISDIENNILINKNNIDINNNNIEVNNNKLTDITYDGTFTIVDKIEINEIKMNGLKQISAFSSTDKNKIYENEGKILLNKNDINTNKVNIQSNTDKLFNVTNNSSSSIFLVDGDVEARGQFVATDANIQFINSLGVSANDITTNNISTSGISINSENQNKAFTDIRCQVTDAFTNVSSTALYTDRQLNLLNSLGNYEGYIGAGDSGGLRIGIDGSSPLIINPDKGHIQLYCSVTTFGDNNGPGKLILYNQGNNTGEIHINNEIQKRAYTEADYTTLTGLSDQTTAIETNENAIQTNANAISALDSRVTNLHNQGISNLFLINLTHQDLSGYGSNKFPNGQTISYTHNLNIGYILYHTYGMTNHFYSSGVWRNNSTWEVSANIRFKGHTSYIYQLQTGFRNINIQDHSIESDTTSSLIDGGLSSSGTGTSFYNTFRYNTGTNYIKASSGGSHLYGNYTFNLCTEYNIKTANSGDIQLKGQLMVRKLDDL